MKCLDSGDYVQIRNSLLVLRKVAPNFPVIISLSLALERRMEKIKVEEKDKRPDLFVLATGYSGVLKTKKSSLIPETEFHIKEPNRLNVAQARKEPSPKVEKKDGEIPAEMKERLTKSDLKNESFKNKNNSSEKPSLTPANTQSSLKRSSSSRIESEQNGLETVRTKTVRVKDERSTNDNSSPMRREEKIISMKSDVEKQFSQKEDKRDRREDRYEKQNANLGERENSDSARDSHYRRNLDVVDGEREHKRRRAEGTSSRSPREPAEREVRSSDKLSDERNGGRDKVLVEIKPHKDPESPLEKPKTKEKKTSRKREHSVDGNPEPRRRRQKADKDEEESSKRIDSERDTRSRREDKSPVIYTSSLDRRTDREEKKHHRSNSASSVKKRS